MRLDKLLWNSAGLNNVPNIRSELEWSDVLSHQVSVRGRLSIGRHLYGRGDANFAFIQSGSVRDSDYAGNDRTFEYSRSISETNGDQMWDLMAGGGYAFRFLRGNLLLAPLVGFSSHKQSLRITNGRQVISTDPPPGYSDPPEVGPLSDELNSMYRATWTSFWAGFDFRYQYIAPSQTTPTIEMGLCLAYHAVADYDGEAEWNLRKNLSHPISFEHDADPTGISVQAEWMLRLARQWHLTCNFNYTSWHADDGEVTTFVVTDSDSSVYEIKTRLNSVQWQSHSIMLGVVFNF